MGSRRSFVGRIAIVAALAIAATASGCGRDASPAKASKTEAKASSETSYRLTGVVRAVDDKNDTVRIRHDAIEGFMGAMTMDFRVADSSTRDGIKAGGEIEAKLRVVMKNGEVTDYALSDIVVTNPAPAPPLKLSVSGSGGPPVLSAAPKRLAPGDLVPDFTMTTQDGTVLKLADLRGKVVALTFIFTRCPMPDFCPAMDKKFSELADRIAAVPGRAEKVRLLSVSFDPEHDTPEILRKHAAMRGAREPLWTFAVASHPELAKIAGPLGLVYGPTENDIIHNLVTAIIDVNGRLVRLETGQEAKKVAPAELFKTMYSQIPGSRG
jgi:protein SCO1